MNVINMFTPPGGTGGRERERSEREVQREAQTGRIK